MPELTEEQQEKINLRSDPERKTYLLTNEILYGLILGGITKAYREEGISLPGNPLDIVVEIVSEYPLPENFKTLKTYYHDKVKFGNLRGGGRKRRKSKKRKSKKRRTKKRKSKKRKSKKRNNLKSNI